MDRLNLVEFESHCVDNNILFYYIYSYRLVTGLACIGIEINWCQGESVTILGSPHAKYFSLPFLLYLHYSTHFIWPWRIVAIELIETCMGLLLSWKRRAEFLQQCFCHTRNTCPDGGESITHIISIPKLKKVHMPTCI